MSETHAGGVYQTDGPLPGSSTEAARPTRAELRRAAEAAATAATAAGAAELSRQERRRQQERQQKARAVRGSIWTAWWLYPLVAAIGVCVYLGFQSAATAPPPAPVVTQITDAP